MNELYFGDNLIFLEPLRGNRHKQFPYTYSNTMKWVIDCREHDLIQLLQMITTEPSLDFKVAQLELGDITCSDEEDNTILIFERKTTADLLASIKDGRYREQSHRLLHASGLAPHQIMYIIEGSTRHSESQNQQITSAMVSLNVCKGCSIMRTNSLADTVNLLVTVQKKITQYGVVSSLGQPTEEPAAYAEVVKKTKKNNLTTENISVVMLSQLPGVSAVMAAHLMKPFGSLFDFLEKIRTDADYLENFRYIDDKGKRPTKKLAKPVVAAIRQFLLPPAPSSSGLTPASPLPVPEK
jgi:ERCC4-type nuclease